MMRAVVARYVVLVLVLTDVFAAPASVAKSGGVEIGADADLFEIPENCDDVEIHDERQNGTENYRLNVDGVVFIYADGYAEQLAGIFQEPDTGEPIVEPVDPVNEDLLPNPIYVSKPSVPLPETNATTSASKTHGRLAKTNEIKDKELANILLPFLKKGAGVYKTTLGSSGGRNNSAAIIKIVTT